jgi:hypothetical protein
LHDQINKHCFPFLHLVGPIGTAPPRLMNRQLARVRNDFRPANIFLPTYCDLAPAIGGSAGTLMAHEIEPSRIPLRFQRVELREFRRARGRE